MPKLRSRDVDDQGHGYRFELLGNKNCKSVTYNLEGSIVAMIRLMS